jgi:hypothetical protein
MKIKTHLRAGKGSSSKAVGSVVTYYDAAAIALAVSRCTGL